ncbi:MAG: TolC family protein [Novipirellula sp. JB048]
MQSLQRVRKKRLLLLAILTATSSGGCSSALSRLASVTNSPLPAASSPSGVISQEGVSQPGGSPQERPRNTPSITDDAVATDGSPSANGSPSVIRPVRYDDAAVFAAMDLILLDEVESQLAADDRGENSVDARAVDAAQATTVPQLNAAMEPSESDDSSDSPPEEAPASGQPADYFVGIALARHPRIQAARQRVAAATHVIPQAKALPDPMFNNTIPLAQDHSLQTAGGRIVHQMSLSQEVPWPGKLRSKATIASREVQIAQAELNRIEREITESVRIAYNELWYATRAIQIIDETTELVDDLTKVAEARYRSGGAQQDVLRAQLESDRLDDQRIQLTKQKEMAQADLAALLQQPVSLIPEATDHLQLSESLGQLDQLIASAEACSPELQGLAWEIQRDRERQRLARLQKYPDLQFGLNLSIISDEDNVLSAVADGHDTLSLTVGTTLPIWREKINAGIREAAHRTSSTAIRREAERDSLYGRLRGLLAQADSLVQQRELYEARIIPRTERTLQLSVADYRGKRADFFSLIETYRELLMFETQLARFDADLATTIAQIDRTVGCPF